MKRGLRTCLFCAPCEAGAHKVFDPSAKEKRREENKEKKREKHERCLCAPWGRRAERFDQSAEEKKGEGRRKRGEEREREKRSTSAAFARLGAGALNVSSAPCILVAQIRNYYSYCYLLLLCEDSIPCLQI